MLCFCRKEAEVELNHKLSRMEAQQAAHCKDLVLECCSLSRRRKRCLLQVHKATEQQDLEEWREGKGKEILPLCGRQQLKLQELMGEEQVQPCKSSALVKERRGLACSKQVGRLVQEDMLWACLKDGAEVAGGDQEGMGGPMPLCVGRREQPLVWQEPGAPQDHG